MKIFRRSPETGSLAQQIKELPVDEQRRLGEELREEGRLDLLVGPFTQADRFERVLRVLDHLPQGGDGLVNHSLQLYRAGEMIVLESTLPDEVGYVSRFIVIDKEVKAVDADGQPLPDQSETSQALDVLEAYAENGGLTLRG
jgi:hypothetical protein